MAEIPKQCWQIAAGDSDRNYADVCLRHGVIIMGPSYCGNWIDESRGDGTTAKRILQRDNWSSRKITNIDTFVHSVCPGDLVILRIGKSEVHGVGFVRTPYEFNELFADVDGWKLAHVHRVEWIWGEKNGKSRVFKNALNFGDTVQRINPDGEKAAALFKWVGTLPEPSGQDLPELPNAGAKLKPRNVSRKLFDYGLGAGSLSALEDRIQDLGSLALWYKNYCDTPSEAETVAHLVVPLLLSLGWTPQKIELEFYQKGLGRTDLALYANGNRKDYTPVALIEAKKFGNSCLTAEGQVRGYAERLEYARRLVVTDGIRYGIFVRDEKGSFPLEPSAYLNLTDLRDDYPVYGECKGADEAMLYLSAAWSHKFMHPATPKKRA